jgi:glycosyltransferase involved in cell wall biosynthesis
MVASRLPTYVIATSWGPQAVSQHFLALGHELAARGARVLLLVDGRQFRAESRTSNPAILTWPSARPTRPRDFIFFARLIRAWGPDALVANFGATNVMMLVGAALGVPVRMVWHHTLLTQIARDRPMSAWRWWYQIQRKRWIYRQATHFSVASGATAAELSDRFGIPPHRILPARLSVADPGHCGSSAGPGRILCVGRLDRSKGQDILLRAGEHLRAVCSEFRLVLAGEGPERATLERLAGTLGLTGQCEFLGQLSPARVLAEMRRAWVTVVASRTEAFGMVNVESLAVGTPVIASAVGGIPEIIRDGVDGYLVPPDDPPALANRLATILQDDKLRARLSYNGRQRFLNVFEQRRVVAEQADRLGQLVHSHPSS